MYFLQILKILINYQWSRAESSTKVLKQLCRSNFAVAFLQLEQNIRDDNLSIWVAKAPFKTYNKHLTLKCKLYQIRFFFKKVLLLTDDLFFGVKHCFEKKIF